MFVATAYLSQKTGVYMTCISHFFPFPTEAQIDNSSYICEEFAQTCSAHSLSCLFLLVEHQPPTASTQHQLLLVIS